MNFTSYETGFGSRLNNGGVIQGQ